MARKIVARALAANSWSFAATILVEHRITAMLCDQYSTVAELPSRLEVIMTSVKQLMTINYYCYCLALAQECP